MTIVSFGYDNCYVIDHPILKADLHIFTLHVVVTLEKNNSYRHGCLLCLGRAAGQS